MPEALKHTVWITVKDLNNFEGELDQVMAAILRTSDKPPLGNVPAYVQNASSIQGLNKQDGAVLKLFCEAAVAKDSVSAFRRSKLLLTRSESVYRAGRF